MQILQNNRYRLQDADEGQGYIDNSDIQQSGDLQYSHILHFQTKVVGAAKMGEENMRAMEVRSRIKLADSVFYTRQQAYRRGDRERIERRIITQQNGQKDEKWAQIRPNPRHNEFLEHQISSQATKTKTPRGGKICFRRLFLYMMTTINKVRPDARSRPLLDDILNHPHREIPLYLLLCHPGG